jgi:hypothetical protein
MNTLELVASLWPLWGPLLGMFIAILVVDGWQ